MKPLKSLILIFTLVITIVGVNTSQTYANETKKDVVIVIDAGHGGNDPGALATTGVYESACNLAIAKAMKTELESYSGVKVYLTRSNDEWSTNTSRAMVAANLKADFLISVHNNSGSATNTGALAYRTVNSLYAEATNDMCSLILENLAGLGLHNGGVQTRISTQYDYEDYYTIIAEGIRGGVPSIIVEHCFLSNPKDAAFISNDNGTINTDNTKAMGIADATAVATYFGLSKRTAVADGESIVELSKGQSVKLSVPGGQGKDVTWYSIDGKIAKVSIDGVVEAIGSGTTNVAYRIAGGETGNCTIVVGDVTPVALVGGIDPTFYATDEEFKAMNSKDVFAHVIYSDGTTSKVTPEYVGTVDYNLTGVQDVEIRYDGLTGYVRVVHNDTDYVPEVTLPAIEEETTVEPSSSEIETTTTAIEDKEDTDKDKLIKILIFVIAVLVIMFIGVLIYLIESNRRRKRGYGRRRRSRSRRYR